MKSSLAAILHSLNMPALSKADLSSLKSLQRDWERHSERMNLLRPERILPDQKAAFAAFLAHPTDENEQRLAVLADEGLTAKRYNLLREAHAELLKRINAEAADILRPVLNSVHQALQAEVNEREEAAQAAGRNKRTDESCVELREALGQVSHGMRMLAEVTGIAHVEEHSPLDLAALLLPGDGVTSAQPASS